MKALPGFRDFFPDDCAKRSYLLSAWRRVARRYGFIEYDGPILEDAQLYAKKNESGAEIMQQLYSFSDKGDRIVAMRPEMTPTLARMLIARERRYRKPLKWFSVATFFRYERQQKGRLREFVQFNADIIGDASTSSDAEMIALAIDVLRELGFVRGDFVVRLSDRRAWMRILESHGCTGDTATQVLQIVDKLEREPDAQIDQRLAPHGLTAAALRDFIASESPADFASVLAELSARGLSDFVEVDLSIVRGLAYYTGLVFEIFDKRKAMRALAGGGRYDTLVRDLSDGAADLPAIGFGMGDVVLGDFIEQTAHAKAARDSAVAADRPCDAYVVIAEEARRANAIGLVQRLREAGTRVDFAFTASRVAKQFQTAEEAGARYAIVVGQEWPIVNVKTLATRQEVSIEQDTLADWLNNREKEN